MFTYGRQRRWPRRRLQTTPKPLLGLICCRRLTCSSAGRTTAYHVGTRRRHIFLFVQFLCGFFGYNIVLYATNLGHWALSTMGSIEQILFIFSLDAIKSNQSRLQFCFVFVGLLIRVVLFVFCAWFVLRHNPQWGWMFHFSLFSGTLVRM